jgi:hypothetical protein
MIDRVSILLLLFACLAPAQETAKSTGKEAAALLEETIRRQNPKGAPLDIKDFEGRMNFKIYEPGPEGEGPSRNEGVSTQKALFVKIGEADELLYRRTIRSTAGGADVTIAFDGARYWVDDDKGRRVLRGRENETERKNASEEVARTKRLLRFFFLENLRAAPEHMALLPEPRVLKIAREEKTCRVIERRVPGERNMTLWIDAKSKVVRRIVIAADAGFSEEDFRFSKHLPLEGTEILVPLSVAYFEAGEKRLEADTDDPKNIRIGLGQAKLTAKDFEFPGGAVDSRPR